MDVDLLGERGEPVPRPAWQIIDAARRAGITGELRLDAQPAASIWLRDGEVYYAERATDGPLSARLLVDGHLTLPQLQRGTVTVNGTDHIGRLFELDPTVDRAAVQVAVEMLTDQALTRVATETVERHTVVLYRRHPSGVDRWFAGRVVSTAPTTSPTAALVPVPDPVPAPPPAPVTVLRPAPLAPTRPTDERPKVEPAGTSVPLRVVPSPPTPPLVVAKTPTRVTPIPIVGPATAPHDDAASLWLAVDPDPTPVAEPQPVGLGADDPTPAVGTGPLAPDPDPGHDPTVAIPRLAHQPDDVLDPTPTTLVKHIAAAVRDAVARADERPESPGA